MIAIDLLKVLNPSDLHKGIAGGVLRLLMKLADDSGYALEVIPHSFDGSMSDQQLAAWYGRKGFRVALMRREPQA